MTSEHRLAAKVTGYCVFAATGILTGGKAVLKPPHSRRFAKIGDVEPSRSVWSAVALAPLFETRSGLAFATNALLAGPARRP